MAITVDLGPDQAALDQIATLRGISKVMALRAALRLYYFLCRKLNDGYRITLERDGERIELLPLLLGPGITEANPPKS